MSDDSPIDGAPQSDEFLLRRFAMQRDEQAFRALVKRYGGLVLSACRRSAPNKADADDAFQATFIVLAQSAGTIRRSESLAAWLYGVAYRVCARLRRDRVRQATSQLLEPVAIYEDPLDELLARHDELVTDEELASLPESLRTPLVLRYLAGKSNEEVADHLGITIEALKGRLKRAKTRLRLRLIRRGVTLAAAVAVLRSTRVANADLPVSLVNTTITLCTEPLPSMTLAMGADTSTPFHLAQQEMIAVKTMLISKPLVTALALGGIATLAVGLPLAISQSLGGEQPTGIALAVDAPAVGPADETPPAARLRSSASADDLYGEPKSENAPRRQSTDDDLFGVGINTSPAAGAASRRGTTSAAALSESQDLEFAPLSAAEVTILNALSKPLNEHGLRFPGVSLEEIMQFLENEYDIQIEIDNVALNDVGVGVDEPITISVRNVKLRSALRLMLRQLGLTYTIKNEVLLITSPEEADEMIDTRVYTIGNWGIGPKELMDIVASTIATDTWSINGGSTADIRQIPEGLVINQNFAVHEQIIDFFRQLDEHAQRVNRGPAAGASAPKPMGRQTQQAEPSRGTTSRNPDSRR